MIKKFEALWKLLWDVCEREHSVIFLRLSIIASNLFFLDDREIIRVYWTWLPFHTTVSRRRRKLCVSRHKCKLQRWRWTLKYGTKQRKRFERLFYDRNINRFSLFTRFIERMSLKHLQDVIFCTFFSTASLFFHDFFIFLWNCSLCPTISVTFTRTFSLMCENKV